MRRDIVSIVRDSYEAYVKKDRALLESLLADDFTFTSPKDNRLNRATYFERCWPNSKDVKKFDFINLVPSGERVFATYELTTSKGRFRNTEIVTVRGGKIVDAEVYFGWDLPHPAKAGGFVADKKK